METLTLIVSNLARRRRSILVVWVWIIASTALALLLSSAVLGTQRVALSQMESLSDITHLNVTGSYGGGAKNILSDDFVSQVKALPGVAYVAPLDYVYGEISFGPYIAYPQLTGVGLGDLSTLGFTSQQGRTALNRGQIIFGYQVPLQFAFRNRPDKQAGQLGTDLTGKVIKLILTKSTTDGQEIHRSYSLQVAGVLGQTGSNSDYSAFISIFDSGRFKGWLLGKTLNRKTDGYDMLVTIANGLSDVEPIQQAITSWGYMADSHLSDIQRVRETTNSLRTATVSVGVMALLSCVIGIFLTTLNIVTERKAEIGLMMAVGATRNRVLGIFMGETAMTGFSGSIAGVGLAFLLRALILDWAKNAAAKQGQTVLFGQDLANISFITPLWLVSLVILLITVFCLMGGAIPARRAASLDPIEALRDE